MYVSMCVAIRSIRRVLLFGSTLYFELFFLFIGAILIFLFFFFLVLFVMVLILFNSGDLYVIASGDFCTFPMFGDEL